MGTKQVSYRKKPKKHLVEAGKATRFKKGDSSPNPKGRKPRAIELKAREFIMKIIDGEEGMERLVKKIFDQAIKGSYKQQELLLNYILGKPVEKLKIDSAYGSQPVVSAPVIKIIADTLRLQRLEKDSEMVIEEDRIVEAEALLEKAIEKPTMELNGHTNGRQK